MLLRRLGLPNLWGDDPETLWRAMRYFVMPATLALAPGSRGYGVERVPRAGGAVIAANHFSAIDPTLVGAFCPRAVYYMAKAELLAVPVIGEVFQYTGAFPVARGEQDVGALRRARRIVREGHVLGMFVEGTRQRFGYPGPVQPGGLVIAMAEGVPVVPCAVESFAWSLRNRRACAVVWGEPLDLGTRSRTEEGHNRAAEVVRRELLRLWRQAAQAVTAGLPPALPDGTPRSHAVPPALLGALGARGKAAARAGSRNGALP
ncbi:MAG: 1-acyl-sn-glycerol-3-phosphate acyltransferase [Actinomycetota bacterium]|nr:1-acyl-sn-glycerol-3-phosphate acyltransferase [Actinomycetota bacterium]